MPITVVRHPQDLLSHRGRETEGKNKQRSKIIASFSKYYEVTTFRVTWAGTL